MLHNYERARLTTTPIVPGGETTHTALHTKSPICNIICMIAPISINSYRRRIKTRDGKSKSQKETCESCKEEVA